MGCKRITNILKKEWRVILHDLNSLLFITLLPLLIVGQVTAVIWLVNHFGGEAILATAMFQNALGKLGQAYPVVAQLPAGEQLQVFLLSQFNFYLLLVPTMIAISLSTFSIVDEKLSGSLEALLATPVRTWELLLGKILSGAVLALIVTWVCAGVFLLAVVGLGWGNLIGSLLSPTWFISLFLLTPAVTVLGFVLGVIGSSRARNARNAQQFALFITLPVLALIGLQVTGVVWFSPGPALLLALGIIIIDVIALRIAVGLFQRESIVVKWR